MNFALNLAKAQVFKVDTIQYKGDTEKFINVVVMGDGYTASEQTKFINDAKTLSNYVFTQAPWNKYINFFNIFAIRVISAQSGAIHPNTASDCKGSTAVPVSNPDTYFGSSFDSYDIHRLVVPTNHTNISNVVAANFPNYDQLLIISNSPYYGGAGGEEYAVSTTHSSSNEITAHEIGHSFPRLADEYYAGDMYNWEAPNMTQQTNPALVKWKNWMGSNGVGIYQHGSSGQAALWYRPHNGCKMRSLGSPFCSVCSEAIVEKIHSLVNPVVAYFPTATNINSAGQFIDFKLTKLVKPTPNTLNILWKLDGNTVFRNVDSIRLETSKLTNGSHTVTARVTDTTNLIRVDNHANLHFNEISWNINIACSIMVTSNPTNGGNVTGLGTYSNGANVSLTATPATGYKFVNWTENGTSVSSNTTYSFTAINNRTLVANFALLSYSISATSTPSNYGAVTGSGTYNYGTNVSLTATPITGYKFVNWTENETPVSTSATYSFTVNSDRTLVANFAIISYSILPISNPANGGTITGSGTYNYGANVALTATPATGYVFINWTENGTMLSNNATYSFTANKDRNLIANFYLNHAPTVSNTIENQQATQDIAFSFTLNINTFADTDANDVLAYQFSTQNSQSLPNWLKYNQQTRTLSGTPTNSEVGVYTIVVTATDKAGASVSTSFVVTVTNVNDAPIVSIPIQDQTVLQDNMLFLSYTNTFKDIDVGDVLSYTVTLADGNKLPSWLQTDDNSLTIFGKPSNDDINNFTVKIVATDKAGASTIMQFKINVLNKNDAPTVVNPIPDQTTEINMLYTFKFQENTFNDIDKNDQLSYDATLSDGSLLPAWLQFFKVNRTFTGKPSGSDVGRVSIKLTATDSFSGSVFTEFKLNVVTSNALNEVESKSFTIFPNPSDGIFYLSVKEGNTRNISVSVIDMLGNIIISKSENSKRIEIDMSRYSKGMYIVQIKTNSEIVRKIMVIR